MKKIAIFLLMFAFITPAFAAEKSYFKTSGSMTKIDIVAIIVDCAGSTDNRQALRQCFVLEFLEKRQELKTIKREAREACTDTDEHAKCFREHIAAAVDAEYAKTDTN